MNWILIVTLSIFSDYYCQSPETSTFQNFEDLHKSDPLIIHGIRQDFVKIPEGEFLMGSDDRSDEQPVHRVRIASFDLAITEVTVRQFRAFVQATRYRTDAETIGHSFACCWRPKLGITWRNPGFLQDDNEPVVAISWNDAMAFCEWLSVVTGRKIRLPSEAEWEFAGSDTTGSYYKSYQEIAWYYDNSGLTTHPVAGKRPNGNGLYDMLGNVSEWMMDIWHPDYEEAPSDGSSRLGEPLTARVSRGGSFEREASEMSLRGRDWYDESESVVGSGFRIVDADISFSRRNF